MFDFALTQDRFTDLLIKFDFKRLEELNRSQTSRRIQSEEQEVRNSLFTHARSDCFLSDSDDVRMFPQRLDGK